MRHRAGLWCGILGCLLIGSTAARADSRGDELASWIDQRGSEVWGQPPQPCDDLTFARRIHLDLLGRVPSLAEIRDYQELGPQRRESLINQIVFGEGPRRDSYTRLTATSLARHWRRMMLPPSANAPGMGAGLEEWLRTAFERGERYDEMMRELVQSPQAAGGYFQLVGASPESYAGQVSRLMLGVRIDCAQCHDHPFAAWQQEDFWGLAAFFGDVGGMAESSAAAATAPIEPAVIRYEGATYPAKLLWSDEPLSGAGGAARVKLADWLTDPANPNFASTAANRFWQVLVGRGLYADLENLDQATPEQRAFLDELGQRFAADGYDVRRLISAICRSAWYEARAENPDAEQPQLAEDGSESDSGTAEFERALKVIGPEQVFDSLEQALHLPVSRIDPSSPRWTGQRAQLVGRLGEAMGASPEDYAAGIPQALLMMNGRMTGNAIDLESSRLLRAVVETPFFERDDRIETLYLAVLTREPTEGERAALAGYLDAKPTDEAREQAYGEILWALLNSPEFVLCR